MRASLVVTACAAQVLWLLEEPSEARPYLQANAERFGISKERIIMTPKSELDVHIQVGPRVGTHTRCNPAQAGSVTQQARRSKAWPT